MRSALQFVLLFALVATFCGCRSADGRQVAVVQAGDPPYTAMRGGFTVRLPVGWKFVEYPPDRLAATIDEVRNQRIVIKYTDLADPLPWTHVVVKADLSPTDLANALTDDLRGDPVVVGVTILESGPAVIGGGHGCKFVARFRNRELSDAEVIKMCYAAVHDARLFILMYDARVGQYYDQGVPAFEETVRTFEFGRR